MINLLLTHWVLLRLPKKIDDAQGRFAGNLRIGRRSDVKDGWEVGYEDNAGISLLEIGNSPMDAANRALAEIKRRGFTW